MKTNINFLTLAIILILVLTSCNDQKKSTPLPNNIDLAVEEVFAEDLMEDVFAETFDILIDLSQFSFAKSEDDLSSIDCRIRTVERPEGKRWPVTVTLDFGESCEDSRGNVRKGKILMTITGNYLDEGSTRTVTFQDYFVNDNQIEGTKVITNAGRENGMLVFNIELTNGKIIRSDGFVIERNATTTRMWTNGEDTPVKWDDVFLINGVVNKVNSNNVKITKTINDLLRARSCRFPLSGTIEISTDNDRPDAILDYGEGDCDKWATVTIGDGDNSETWIVDLSKRGKNWKKQDADSGVEKDSD